MGWGHGPAACQRERAHLWSGLHRWRTNSEDEEEEKGQRGGEKGQVQKIYELERGLASHIKSQIRGGASTVCSAEHFSSRMAQDISCRYSGRASIRDEMG
ncbi:unnamed protein product [Prorocentrum cordatum]|uniref:Uncharacterized protein n=1 Tax=Prorocentrum cordatum TaxID=2364126 RepID=A0ABN9PBS0_9DINO|nr:unnamed protein product [Polarella glacialis]